MLNQDLGLLYLKPPYLHLALEFELKDDHLAFDKADWLVQQNQLPPQSCDHESHLILVGAALDLKAF